MSAFPSRASKQAFLSQFVASEGALYSPPGLNQNLTLPCGSPGSTFKRYVESATGHGRRMLKSEGRIEPAFHGGQTRSRSGSCCPDPALPTFFLARFSANNVLSKLLHPDAARGRFAKMDGLSVHAQGHGFIVLALQHIDSRGRPQVQSFEKFQQLRIFLIHAENFAGILRAQVRKQHRSLFTQRRDSPAHRHAMRAALFVTETFDE